MNSRTGTVIADRSYKTFTVGIDENLDRRSTNSKRNSARRPGGHVSDGDRVVASGCRGKDRGLKLTISDQNDVVKKEIVIA